MFNMLSTTVLLIFVIQEFVMSGSVSTQAASIASSHQPSHMIRSNGESAVPSIRFDVVSIKPHKSKGPWNLGIGTDDYHAVGLPLSATIKRAYFAPAFVASAESIGLPSWAELDSYDFIGKVSSNDLAAWQQAKVPVGSTTPNPMLQTLLQNALSDRCKLISHLKPVNVLVYGLVVSDRAKLLKLKESGDKVEPHSEALTISDGGLIIPITNLSDPTLTFYNTSMASLATEMSQLYGSPIVDRTGLTRKYDFIIKKVSPDDDPSRAFDFGALGLKIVRITVPSYQLVIDHIEKPSPN